MLAPHQSRLGRCNTGETHSPTQSAPSFTICASFSSPFPKPLLFPLLPHHLAISPAFLTSSPASSPPCFPGILSPSSPCFPASSFPSSPCLSCLHSHLHLPASPASTPPLHLPIPFALLTSSPLSLPHLCLL